MTHADERGTFVEPLAAATMAAPLPLPAGLAALGDEIAPGRSALPLSRLASELQQGRGLADAAADPRVGLPAQLIELLRAGAASGQLMEFAARYAAMVRRRRAFRQELWLLLFYPTLLLGVLFFVGVVNWLVFQPIFTKFFVDFQLAVPGWVVSIAWLMGPGLASLTGVAAIAALLFAATWGVGGKRIAHLLRQSIPLLGPAYGYQGVSEFAELLGLSVRSGMQLPGALRCTALGMNDATCAVYSEELAADVERGMGLGQALEARHSLLSPLAPLVTYGEQHGVLADSLDAAADMYAGRTEVQANLLRVALPPMLVLVVAGLIGLMFLVFMLPLFQLIQSLT